MHALSLCRSYTELAVRTLANIAQKGQSESARVAAAAILLDRGWGKAPQAHAGNNGEGPITVEIVYRQREPAKLIEIKPNGAPPTAA